MSATEQAAIERLNLSNRYFNESDPTPSAGTPWCFYHASASGYRIESYASATQGSSFNASLKRDRPSGHGVDLMSLRFQVIAESDARLHIRIGDPDDSKRFRPPYPVAATNDNSSTTNPLYRVQVQRAEPFAFAVVRISDGEVLFDSNVAAPLVFAEQFIELSARLSTSNVYGLGEHVDRFKHNFRWNRFTFWNTDGVPVENEPLYGSQAFYLALQENGAAHGVFMLNSGAMEVTLRPEQMITYRLLSGEIDLYFFLGPSAQQVVEQYAQLVGRPFMPPYWSLGYHLSRYGYGGFFPF